MMQPGSFEKVFLALFPVHQVENAVIGLRRRRRVDRCPIITVIIIFLAAPLRGKSRPVPASLCGRPTAERPVEPLLSRADSPADQRSSRRRARKQYAPLKQAAKHCTYNYVPTATSMAPFSGNMNGACAPSVTRHVLLVEVCSISPNMILA